MTEASWSHLATSRLPMACWSHRQQSTLGRRHRPPSRGKLFARTNAWTLSAKILRKKARAWMLLPLYETCIDHGIHLLGVRARLIAELRQSDEHRPAPPTTCRLNTSSAMLLLSAMTCGTELIVRMWSTSLTASRLGRQLPAPCEQGKSLSPLASGGTRIAYPVVPTSRPSGSSPIRLT